MNKKNIKNQNCNCNCNLKKIYARNKFLCYSCDKDEIEELVQNNEPYFVIEQNPRLINATDYINNIGKLIVDLQVKENTKNNNEILLNYLRNEIKNIEKQPTYKIV